MQDIPIHNRILFKRHEDLTTESVTYYEPLDDSNFKDGVETGGRVDEDISEGNGAHENNRRTVRFITTAVFLCKIQTGGGFMFNQRIEIEINYLNM